VSIISYNACVIFQVDAVVDVRPRCGPSSRRTCYYGKTKMSTTIWYYYSIFASSERVTCIVPIYTPSLCNIIITNKYCTLCHYAIVINYFDSDSACTGSLLLCIRLYHHMCSLNDKRARCTHTLTHIIIIIRTLLLCRTYPLSEHPDEYYCGEGGVISLLPSNYYTKMSSFSNIIRDDDNNSDNNNCHRDVFSHSGVFFDNDRGGHTWIYSCIPISSPISSSYSYCII